MDLHQLQAFDQIVVHGSFSKAARHLGVSQPTISLRIRALEQEVAGALFLRHGRQLRLTELRVADRDRWFSPRRRGPAVPCRRWCRLGSPRLAR